MIDVLFVAVPKKDDVFVVNFQETYCFEMLHSDLMYFQMLWTLKKKVIGCDHVGLDFRFENTYACSGIIRIDDLTTRHDISLMVLYA